MARSSPNGNYEALAKWSTHKIRHELQRECVTKIDRNSIDEELVQKAHDFINQIDLAEGSEFLQEDYGVKMLSTWMLNKFGIQITVNTQSELADVKEQLCKAAEDAYREREVRYPMEAALNTYCRSLSR